jgi:hypothetical protein
LQQQALVDVTVPITITDQANIGFGYSSFSGRSKFRTSRSGTSTGGDPARQHLGRGRLSRVYQDVFSVEGTPGTVPNANSTYLNAAARLTNFACPSGRARR